MVREGFACFVSRARSAVGHPSGPRPDADFPQSRPMADVVQTLESVLAEADVLVRLRLKEIDLEVPHLVVAVTLLRSNVSPDGLRSFSEDLKNIADELTAPPEPGDTTHLSFGSKSRACASPSGGRAHTP
jgi:hypothetical protein